MSRIVVMMVVFLIVMTSLIVSIFLICAISLIFSDRSELLDGCDRPIVMTVLIIICSLIIDPSPVAVISLIHLITPVIPFIVKPLIHLITRRYL
jgi:hypothetical protein